MSGRLAIHGGTPVRDQLLAYARPCLDSDDIEAVTAVLRTPWLTTGPQVAAFESAFASVVGASHAVAVSSGTAALHAMLHALGVGPGDEVIVPTLTFAATASTVVMCGATPVFVDVLPDTLLVDPDAVAAHIGERTKAVVAVDYAGQPCDYAALATLAAAHGMAVLADCCHALGARIDDRPVGCVADMSAFSLHPVKHITTAEGGMVTTESAEGAERMRRFRNHGISRDHRARSEQQSWTYEITELGYNYRLSDMQCALGISQLRRLPAFLAARRAVAARYDDAFSRMPHVSPLLTANNVQHAYHLYVVQLDGAALAGGRAEVFRALRAEGIGVNVHYQPVHTQPFYAERFSASCPVAEAAYDNILSLPMFAGMSDDDVGDVIEAMHKVLTALSA